MPVVATYPNREAWLKARRLSIGSSDACTILGIPFVPGAEPKKSPLELWAEKTGKPGFEPETNGDNIRLRFGHAAEPIVSDAASKVLEEDQWIYDPGDFTIARNVDDPHLAATVDRLVGSKNPETIIDRFVEADGPGELKTVELYAAKDWDHEPSHYALVQVQHQMLVGGWPEAWVFAMVGFSQFKHYHVEANSTFQAMMLQELDQFWSCVERDEPPAVDASDACRKALAILHPDEVEGETIHLGTYFHTLALKRREAIAMVKYGEAQRNLAEHELMLAIGDAEIATVEGLDKAFRWKVEPRKGYTRTVEPSRPRIFREVKKPKGESE
jgi:predicted phage-related endonuclease